METKFCKHCQCEHPFTKEFWYFGARNYCCCKIQKKQSSQVRSAEISQYQKGYRDSHTEERKGYAKEYRKGYYKVNADRITAKVKAYRTINAEKIRAYHTEYDRVNADRRRHYELHKLHADLNFNLKKKLRTRLRGALKNNQKAGSAVSDLGCTIPELKQYLESKFQDGMTWENWNLNGWHIDHIVPLASFDLTDREQFLKACHYTNLQPLWAKDNMKKSDKVA